MQAAFWHKKWADNQIGFHQSQVNPYLQAHWPTLQLAPGSRVLVPLCGKSLDVLWLAGQGHQVRGIELSAEAIQAFFAGNGLQPEVSRHGRFEVWRSGEIELWCGDIFDLQAADLADCVGLYDRAALIALPQEMRSSYLHLLGDGLPTGAKGLLVTLEYDQARIDGPPFSVAEDEVREGFAGWQIDALEAQQIITESPKFTQAGVSSLLERAYHLYR
nr:thiopurine S-methyltransferase [uncultured Pseudomonas sp.]